MPVDIAKKAIETTAEHLMKINDKNLGIRFFGGEPLLAWKLIPDLVSYAENVGKQKNLNVSYAIATNGTLLNEKHCDFFVEHDFAVGLSIDGTKEVHDRNRGWIDGSSSFLDVLEKVKLAVAKNLRMELVLVADPSNVSDLAESIRYLHQETGAYFYTVSFNIHDNWSEEDIANLEKAYESLGNLYAEHFNAGKPIQIDFLNNKMNVLLRGGFIREFLCDIGKTDLAVTPGGDFYPCLRLAAMDREGATVIGNINDGLNRDAIRKLKSIADNRFDMKKLPKECHSCMNSTNCLNWCAAANLAMTGNPAKVGELMCSHERISIQVARNTLNNIDLNLYRRLYAEYFKPDIPQYISTAIPHSEVGLQYSKN
jgi:uncharacterized protein